MSYLAISWLCLLAFFIVVILEMLLPSAGVLFVVSVVLAGAAVIAGFLHSLYLGAAMVALLVVSMPALFALFAHVWPRTPIGKRLIRDAPSPESVLPTIATQHSLDEYKGMKAQVVSPMLPTGSIRIAERTLVATSETGAIEVGEWVRVVRIQMNRMFVIPIEASDDLQAPGGFEQKVDQAVQEALHDFDWENDPPDKRS